MSDDIHVSWWFRVKALFAHSKTILVARLYSIAGALVVLHDSALPYIASTDITPLTSRLPPWAWPLIIIGTGLIFDWLRHYTIQSLQENKTEAIIAQIEK